MKSYSIRFPYTYPTKHVQSILKQAITHIFQNHSSEALTIDCVITANIVLKHNLKNQYSCFYGQDNSYSKKKGLNYQTVYTLSEPREYLKIPVQFETMDFARIAQDQFTDSHVYIFDVVNCIYILRFLQPNNFLNFRGKQREITLQDVV